MSMKRPRWQKKGISDLSWAVDEIYFLRGMLADEADILTAHLGFKTFPKSRRKYAEQQIERMRAAARGDLENARRGSTSSYSTRRALERLGIDPMLTNSQWAAQRGLTEVGPDDEPS